MPVRRPDRVVAVEVSAMPDTTIRLPSLIGGARSSRLVAWRKRPGERFRRGETLALLEADGRLIELPALAPGRFLGGLAEIGRALEPGTPLARIENDAPHAPLAPATTLYLAAGEGRIALRCWPSRSGRTVLLLHGFGGEKSGWAAIAAKLWRGGVSVLAADLPGHGESEATDTTPAAMARRLALALGDAALGLCDTAMEVAGHSLGAAVAVELARAIPERIAALSLIAPLGFGQAADQSFVDGLVEAADRPALERLLATASLKPLTFPDGAWRHMLAELGRPGRAAERAAIAKATVQGGRQLIDLARQVSELTLPVRILLGRHDRIVGTEAAMRLPGRVALHLFETGHLIHWEEPGTVAEVLARSP